MKNCFAILCFIMLSFPFGTSAQYKWTGTRYSDSLRIPNTVSPLKKVCYKGFGSKMRMYIPSDSNIITKDIDLTHLSLIGVDTIKLEGNSISYSDFVVGEKNDIIVGFQRIYVYDRQTRTTAVYDLPGKQYRNGQKLNDSLILLYDIYKFHPGDDFPGLHMGIFNLLSKQLTVSKVYAFAGIELSHMTINWLTCTSNGIYVTTPLSGKLTRYNYDLTPMDSFSLPIRWINQKKNLRFEKESDRLCYSQWNSAHAIYLKYGSDSVNRNRGLINDSMFSKDRISRILAYTRSDLQYIERLIPYSDSVFIVTVSKPSSKPDQYRDLIFYNYRRKKVENYISDWVTGQLDTLNKFEDFFCVDVINDSKIAPYFLDRKVYFHTNFKPSLFKTGPKADLRKILFKDIKQNNYEWNLLEYTF